MKTPETRLNRVTRGTSFVLITLVLGFVSSGMWDFWGQGLSESLLMASSQLAGSFRDMFYFQVGEGANNGMVALIPFILTILFLGFIILILETPIRTMQDEITVIVDELDDELHPNKLDEDAKKSKEEQKIELESFQHEGKQMLRKLRIVQRGIQVLMLAIFVSGGFESFRISNNYVAAMRIERHIDIISPFVSENERLELRAKYRMIQSFDQYEQLSHELDSLTLEFADSMGAIVN